MCTLVLAVQVKKTEKVWRKKGSASVSGLETQISNAITRMLFDNDFGFRCLSIALQNSIGRTKGRLTCLENASFYHDQMRANPI